MYYILHNVEYEEAIGLYTEALQVYPEDCSSERSVCHANRAACYVKMVSYVHHTIYHVTMVHIHVYNILSERKVTILTCDVEHVIEY